MSDLTVKYKPLKGVKQQIKIKNMNYDEIRILEIKDSIDAESESYNMDEFIQFTRNLQISELEPLLNEKEYDEDKLQSDKYFFLSVLREIFSEFKS
ncbi:MAG: hypothetical protein IPN72_14005 [Saprospiraceae bacterium]|nr:hypothetical protein [Saprospiraceae bacterium]